MKRRAFLGGTLSAVASGTCKAQSVTTTAQNAVVQTPPEPLVWPIVTKPQPGIRGAVAGLVGIEGGVVSGVAQPRITRR